MWSFNELCQNFADGSDYTGVNETLTFGAGLPAEMCVDIRVSEDDLVETDEVLTLVLNSSDLAVVLMEPDTATVTIVNTDGKGIIQ